MSQTQQHQQQDRATIPSRPIDLTPIADSITSTILHCRDSLPTQSNGRPKAPSSDRAAQIRKEMSGGRSAEVLRLLTVSVTDLEDGVPYHVATAGLTRLLTFLSVYAKALHRRAPRSIPAAFHAETRWQHRGDVAAHRVVFPGSCDEASLTDAIATARAHAASLEDFAVACEAELASRHSSRVYAMKALQA